MLGFRNRNNGYERVRPEVKEVRDEFLNIYRRVLDNEKDWASRFTEETTPQTQKDLDIINSVKVQIENLINAITEKFNIIDGINKGIVPKGGMKKRETVEKYGRSADIIRPYNEIIRKYNSPSVNDKTRDEIKSSIQQIVPILNQTIAMTEKTFRDKFLNSLNDASERRAREYLLPMIPTFLALLVIQKNLFRRTYTVIDKPQLDIQYQEWLSTYEEPIRRFFGLIQNPTGETEAAERRQKLIEEDRGYPLSEVERLRLHNTMFGITSERNYTPEELVLLEEEAKRDAEFSERRQEDIERRTTEARLRAMAGEQPVLITPEMPLPEAVGSLEPQDVSVMKRQQIIENYAAEFQKFLDNAEVAFNKSMNRNKLNPTDSDDTVSADTERRRIKNVIDLIVTLYEKGFKLINGTSPTLAQTQSFIDDKIYTVEDRYGWVNLTEEYLMQGDPRLLEEQREDIYNSLINAYKGMVESLKDTFYDLVQKIEAGEATNLKSLEPQDISLMKRQQTVETMLLSFQNFLENAEEAFSNSIKSNKLKPTDISRVSANTERKRIKNVIGLIVSTYEKGFEFINGKKPTIAQTQSLIDEKIYTVQDRRSFPNLTPESLLEGNPRSNSEQREDIYNSLIGAYEGMVESLNVTFDDLVKKIEAGEATNLGRGKPRNKISPALHYNEARNDPYLIR